MSSAFHLYALGSNGKFQLGLPHDDDIDRPEKCSLNDESPLKGSTPEAISDFALPNNYPPLRYLLNGQNWAQQSHASLWSDETILSLNSGGNHTLLLTSHGRVFVAGSNEYGQSSLLPPSTTAIDRGLAAGISQASSTSDNTNTQSSSRTSGFHVLPWTGRHKGNHVTHIAATFTATFLVVASSGLYTIGYGPKGELALGRDKTISHAPTLAFFLHHHEAPEVKIERLSACMDHGLLLTTSGNVYGWGAARKGQLGGQSRASGAEVGGCVWTVSRREIAFGTALAFQPYELVTGRDFSFVTTLTDPRSGHRTRGFGRIVDMDVPSDLLQVDEFTPRTAEGKLLLEEEGYQRHVLRLGPIQVHAGWSSLVAHQVLTGVLKGFGRNNRGQIPPPTLPHVLQIAVGSEHCVALLENGSVVSWGWGEHGNCGSEVDARGVVAGRWNVLFEPSQGTDEVGRYKEKVVGVGAGCATTFFWTERDYGST